MRSEHKISFVVTARDEPADVLAATIDGLLATSTGQDREIVIVDDGSQEAVTIERPGTRVVRNAKALGVAQSRRLGAAMTTGDVLVWTDAHMSFAPDWLEEMLRHVDTGALLGASWWNYELTRPLCYGAEFVWCADRDHHAGRSPGLAFRHRTRFPGEGAVEVPMVIGACYMALRESYEHCGGFSPYFRIWGKSEQDVSARMWITGRGVKCVTGARVGHLSRPQFPYPVSWSDIEFNQVVLFRALLEHATLQAVERILGPLPEQVEKRLAEVDLRAWRESIQSRRSMSDFEFFRRFVSDAPASLTALGPNTPMTA
jgi:glycosyltransferase involved in cell wall biosynthesis